MAYIADLDPNNSVTAARIAAEEAAYYSADVRELDPEDVRVPVSEDDFPLSSQQDREDLEWVLAWEEYHL